MENSLYNALYYFTFYALPCFGIAIGALCGYKSRKVAILAGSLWMLVPGLLSALLTVLSSGHFPIELFEALFLAIRSIIILVYTIGCFAIGIVIALLRKKLARINLQIDSLQERGQV
ncbi:MAG: hypothetical protein IJY89_01530 [Clostridia bacterium]|nr:hypothetical protein [Clostridia bacterium]